MNKIKALKELAEVFGKYDCNIYDFCYYLFIHFNGQEANKLRLEHGNP